MSTKTDTVKLWERANRYFGELSRMEIFWNTKLSLHKMSEKQMESYKDNYLAMTYQFKAQTGDKTLQHRAIICLNMRDITNESKLLDCLAEQAIIIAGSEYRHKIWQRLEGVICD